MDNFSDDDLSLKDNSTNATYVPDATSLGEYRAAVVLWKAGMPCLLLLGGFGNIATIFIMRRIKDHNSSQHAILMVLAMSDFMVLYCGGSREWIRHMYHVDVRNLHDWTCKIHKWLLYGGCAMSAWLLTCVTVQRTMAILWPHRMKMVWTVRRTRIVIATLVFAAFGCHFHLILGLETSRYNRCDARPGVYEYFYRNILMLLDMFLTSLLPSVCQFICDVILSFTLFKTASGAPLAVHAISNAANNNACKSDGRRKTASRTTVMVLTLSCTFVVLNMPMYVFYTIWYRDLDIFITETPEVLARMKMVSTVTHLMGYTNYAVNFFLYCLTGTKYRTEFLSWILCRDRRATSVGVAASERRGNSVALS
ncbi:hypothetical protein ACOMHN_040599 [Nucella lapillus]